MLTLLLMSCCTVAAALVTVNRIGGLRKWLGYAAVVDVLFTLALFAAFKGTFSGTVVAAMTGLLMTLVLSALKRLVGYDRLAVRNRRIVWVHFPASVHVPRPRMPKVRVEF